MCARKMMGAVMVYASLSAAPSHAATNYVIGLATPPAPGSQDEIKEAVKDLVKHLVVGDTVTVMNATKREVVGPRLELKPGDWEEKTQAQRDRAMSQLYIAVGGLLRGPAPPDALPGNLVLPEVLAEIGRTIIGILPGARAEVLLIGNALYTSPSTDLTDHGFDMRNRYFPNDANLFENRSGSPYGVKGRSTALQGVLVHLCYTESEAQWPSSGYRDQIERFWSLFVNGRAATSDRSLHSRLRAWMATMHMRYHRKDMWSRITTLRWRWSAKKGLCPIQSHSWRMLLPQQPGCSLCQSATYLRQLRRCRSGLA